MLATVAGLRAGNGTFSVLIGVSSAGNRQVLVLEILR